MNKKISKNDMVVTDAWILAIPDGRNDRCPCGCGTKWKKVELNIGPHYETFKENLENEIRTNWN